MQFRNHPIGELFAQSTRNGLTRPKAARGAVTKIVNMRELFANSRIRSILMDRGPPRRAQATRSTLRIGDLLFALQSRVLEGAGHDTKLNIDVGRKAKNSVQSRAVVRELDKFCRNSVKC